MLSQAEIYRAAMRLIERHGAAAEIAAILRGDAILSDDRARERVLQAIAELRLATSRPAI